MVCETFFKKVFFNEAKYVIIKYSVFHTLSGNARLKNSKAVF